MKPPRLHFWITLIFLLALACGVYIYAKSKLPSAISVDFSGQPTIGYAQARVHVVVFKEPKCSNCRLFNLTVYPEIKKEFIDTNKITYTVIPVSFLPGSMPAAVAYLCARHADPDYPNNELFFTYMDYVYEHLPDEQTNWATLDKLLTFAHDASPAIQIDRLKECIEREKYRIQIQKNTDYGRQLMGGVISTPTVFVNGIRATDLSEKGLSKLIQEVLNQQGG